MGCLFLITRFISFSLLLFSPLFGGCTSFIGKRFETIADVPPLSSDEVLLQVRALDHNLSLCNQTDPFFITNTNTNVFTINEKEYILQVLCFVGAYQGTYQYLWYSALHPSLKIVDFLTFQEGEKGLQLTETNILTGTAEFNDHILTVDTKARALGDCGSVATYEWGDGRFMLQEYRHKAQCDGVYGQEYPLIYP